MTRVEPPCANMRIRRLPAVLLACLLGQACSGAAGGSGETWSPRLAAPISPLIVLSHEDSSVLTVFNTATGSVDAVVDLGHREGRSIALNRDASLIAAAVPGGIALVEVSTRKTLRTLPFPSETSGLAFGNGVLFVTEAFDDKGRISAIALDDGRTVATQAIKGLGRAADVSADGRRVFVPHHFYSGFVTTLNALTLEDVASTKFEDGANSTTLSLDEHWLYVPNGSTFSGRSRLSTPRRISSQETSTPEGSRRTLCSPTTARAHSCRSSVPAKSLSST